MAYKIPWSNFHELNLDWLLEQVKQLREDVDGITAGAIPSTTVPLMDGVADVGSEVNFSRGDHRHPTDTSRAAQSDLTQEVTDRGNADLALASDIADVDAKIKFSSAAPLMDSGSASSGFSDYMARADHVHPTDTSRASATDLATLTVRVDNITGAASPYDVTPLMDGVGSYGTVGAYSRGDHRHPSDTSKLDVAGGTITGDLDVQGYLTESGKLKYQQVNAIGWMRAITAPLIDGTCIKIRIARKGTIAPSEVHKITYIYNQNGPSFVDEESCGDVLYVNKIRISDAGKIDFHMDDTAESQISVYIEATAPTDAATKDIETSTITGVADAPVGETILGEYTFNENAGYDPLVLEGSDTEWTWRKYQSGKVEMWGYVSKSIVINTSTGSLYYNNDEASVTLPVALTNVGGTPPAVLEATIASSNLVFLGRAYFTGTDTVGLRVLRAIGVNNALTIPVHIHVIGTWK